MRLDIGWKKERFSTAPGLAYRPTPLTILSPLHVPFLREQYPWIVAISTGDLQSAAERARAAAAEAGELRPAREGKVTVDIPEAIRLAIREDLVSGAYQQAAQEAVAGDPDLVQG